MELQRTTRILLMAILAGTAAIAAAQAPYPAKPIRFMVGFPP